MLQEKKHIGDQEYFKTNIEFARGENAIFTASTKRSLVTNSAEYYNLSYEYLNDCLRAGIVFRRKFYQDRDVEHADSLMFQISLIPLGDVFSPKIK